MKKPTVSVIIPTYNRAKLLEKAVESVLAQDYENLKEIIITDDCSTDNTEEVVEKLKKVDFRIIYVKNTKYPPGPTGNKNNGLDYASGDFIGILDDDDILLPGAISKLINIYLEKGYKLIFANCLKSDDKKFSGKSYGKSEEVTFKDIICGKYEGEYWGIFHKDLLKGKKFISETWGGEGLLWWQFYKITPAYYLNEPVRLYNVENSKRVSERYLQFPKRTFLNYKYTIDLFGKDLLKMCPKRFIKICILASFFAKLAGDFKNSLKYSFLAFKGKNLRLIKLIWLIFILLPLPRYFYVKMFLLGKKLLKNLF